ncbi:MAG: IS66 family transposase [Armatimonadetes bacterium]|nr:IS66 family transposase [Armatimonadota bacterium]
MKAIVDIASEKDPARLRQIAQLALADNDRLVKRIVTLTRELAALRGASQQDLALELQRLKEDLAELKGKVFGRSSERRPKDGAGGKGGENKPRRGHGPRLQLNLERLEETHCLPENACTCPYCEGRIEQWVGQEEVSEEVDVIERRIVIRAHTHLKYHCPHCHAYVTTASGPVRLIPGGRYSTNFAIDVAVDKYSDHLPLERQVRVFRRQGLAVSSQTLWDQIFALMQLLRDPVYEALGRFVLSSGVVHADETKWRMLSSGNTKAWYLWGVSRLEAAFYKILDSRSAQSGGELLGDYDGTVVCDGYDVYPKIARDSASGQLRLTKQDAEAEGEADAAPPPVGGNRFKTAGCWAHTRRKFVKAEPHEPEACKEIIDLIGKLYDVERQVPFEIAAGEVLAKQLGLRAELRERISKGVVDEIYAWAARNKGLFIPQSKMGKAIGYLENQRKHLEVFLTDPRVSIDNNRMERGLRGPVVGRKNFYGVKSKRGAEVAAVFYSIFESCKLCGVEPKAYLRYVTYELLGGAESAPLPHDYAKKRERGEMDEEPKTSGSS